MRSGGRRRWLWAVVAGLAPWAWFAVRNLGFVFDLVAIGLPVGLAGAALALAVAGAVRHRPELAAGVVSCLLAAGVVVVGPGRPEPVPPPVTALRIVSANVNSHNRSLDRAVADALAQRGDLVLLIEAGKGTVVPPADYPTVIRPKYSNQVILSRFPARLLDRPAVWPKNFRAHRLQVEAPSGPVVVYVVHLVRPHLGPRRIWRIRSQMHAQRKERESLLAAARAETVPVVLAGDFNTPDRSSGYRHLRSRFRDAMRARRAGPTYMGRGWSKLLWRPFLLRIDHVFMPEDWCSGRPERFTLHGSDHRGVAVDVGPCPVL
ncbi:MAG TPA: endonuclease/exonuclease/phosphatase family protein [Acidimicrobiia bacterium]|nr:endonuclease/exonuclease/phosphatase family protein [Acidimicrobiia bacterium]